MKIYIDDFVEDLNYRRVILYIGNVDTSKLYSKMCEDRVNHMNRFDGVLYNKLMFVENEDSRDKVLLKQLVSTQDAISDWLTAHGK